MTTGPEFQTCPATVPVDGEPDMVWTCPQPLHHQGDHGDAEYSWPFNRCPVCGATVPLDDPGLTESGIIPGWFRPARYTHECTRNWERPEYGMTGSQQTRAAVINGRLAITSAGSSSASGVGAVMAMGSPMIEKWYMEREPDPADVPEAER